MAAAATASATAHRTRRAWPQAGGRATGRPGAPPGGGGGAPRGGGGRGGGGGAPGGGGGGPAGGWGGGGAGGGAAEGGNPRRDREADGGVDVDRGDALGQVHVVVAARVGVEAGADRADDLDVGVA